MFNIEIWLLVPSIYKYYLQISVLIFVVWNCSLYVLSLLRQAVQKRHIIHWSLHTVRNTLKSKQHKIRFVF